LEVGVAQRCQHRLDGGIGLALLEHHVDHHQPVVSGQDLPSMVCSPDEWKWDWVSRKWRLRIDAAAAASTWMAWPASASLPGRACSKAWA
jgi:hypothetical protein